MYFAIAWKNLKLSEKELSLIWKILFKEWRIFFFNTNDFEKCKYLSWFVKIWEVISIDNFVNIEKKLLWSNMYLKPYHKEKFNFKRYKQIDLLKSDLEIKNKGIEAIFFKSIKDSVWIVKIYQNIDFYETIDFSKPVRSMWIWMMPAKLTHLMINLATWLNYWKTIYDPFSGLWTTLMMANYLWNNTIWSDLNITPTKQNCKWFMSITYFKRNYKCFMFKQDVTNKINQKIADLSDLIVTEWYLWPRIWKFLNQKEAEFLEKEIQNIYIQWINNLLKLKKLKKIVITFPVYKLKNWNIFFFNSTYEKISQITKFELIDEIYIRPNQKVWRQIWIFYK